MRDIGVKPHLELGDALGQVLLGSYQYKPFDGLLLNTRTLLMWHGISHVSPEVHRARRACGGVLVVLTPG